MLCLVLAGVFSAMPASAFPSGQAVKVPSGPTAPVSYDDGTYVVTLKDEPAATYTGTNRRFSATAPEEGQQLKADAAPVEAYSAYLERKQESVAASVGASVGYTYTLALNGFSAELSGDQAAALAARRDVAAVTKTEVRQLQRSATAALSPSRSVTPTPAQTLTSATADPSSAAAAAPTSTPADASTPTDTATPADASTPTDTATPADASTPTDTATPTDASTPTDTATPGATLAQASPDHTTAAAPAAVATRFPNVGQESSVDFLGLTGNTGVWSRLGGHSEAGAGIVIGDIDSGIAPENPSFAGASLGTTPGAAPYRDGSGQIVFAKSDGTNFVGECELGEGPDAQWTGNECNTKLIGARWFLPTSYWDRVGSPDRPEFLSPRDGDGHGSHTTSTAGGNFGVDATIGTDDFGEISGVAPAAKVAEYKVCWNGNGGDLDDGCFGDSILAAIEAAVKDGVDVINYSIGGGAATSTFTLEDQAFFGAAAAGIFVSASAGNSGPAPSTLDHASPWYTTVAASSIPTYMATAELGNGLSFAGASITVPAAPLTALLAASTAVAGSTGNAEVCQAGSLDPVKAAGKVIVCSAGQTARVSKSAEVARAGGVGMLLVNPSPYAIMVDSHAVPTIHLDFQAHDAVYAYAATPGATVTLVRGDKTGRPRPVPQVAGFSSRGPAEADGADVLKPDVTAPGVSILADGMNQQNEDPTFQFESGTSMSAPHVAGLAALLLTQNPTASASAIRSALMTSSYPARTPDGGTSADVFAQGAGHVDPTRMLDPGLVYDSGPDDWRAFLEGEGYVFSQPTGVEPIDPSDLNQASIAIGALAGTQTVTRTVTSTAAGEYTAAVSIPGVDVTVSPSTLSFTGAGQKATYSVTFAVTTAPLKTFATGYLIWTERGGGTVRSPVAVRPVAVAAPYEVQGTGNAGSVSVPLTPGTDGTIPLSVTPFARGALVQDASASDGHSGTLPTGAQSVSEMVIPDGATFARFDLDAMDDTADLDLSVERLDANGDVVAAYQSATGAADERVDLQNPPAATYRVTVDIYSAPSGSRAAAVSSSGSGMATFDLTEYVLGVGAASGSLTTSPAGLTSVKGQRTSYDAQWAGLDGPARFLGAVSYGNTGSYTLVSVTTTQAASTPTPTPTPTPSASESAPTTAPNPSVAGSGGGASGRLAQTGAPDNGLMVAGGAVALLVAGMVALIVARRRRRT